VPWKPKLAEPPVARPPFQVTLDAVTAVPVCFTVAFHELVTCWLPVNVQPSAHELTAEPPLVTVTSAVKPADHELGL